MTAHVIVCLGFKRLPLDFWLISACSVHKQDLPSIRGNGRNRTALPTALEELSDCVTAAHSPESHNDGQSLPRPQI